MTPRPRQTLTGLIVVAAAAVCVAAVAARQDDPPQPKADAAASADEKAVRELVERFASAYNHKDADAVAALFTPDARVYSEDGRRAEGRPAIRARFAATFEAAPELKIRLDTTSIRFLSADVAIEDGAAVATEPADLDATTHYTAVHVRRDGKWLTAEVRDRPAHQDEAEADHRDEGDHALADLGWLTGEWVDEDDEGVAHTSGRWADGHAYILRDFTVRLQGLPPSHGTQRIGWDPVRQTVRSWAFDSEGGYTESTWTHVGPDRWIIKSNGFLRDGRATSSTNTLTRLSPDAFLWASADRVLGDEELSEVEEVLVVRRPPAPTIGKK